MSYCSTDDLVAATGSAYEAATLQALIDSADRQIDARLAPHGLAGSGNAIREASLALSTSMLLTRMRADGKKPSSLSVGGLSMSDNNDAAIAALEAKAERLVSDFVAAQLASKRRRAWVRVQ